MACLDLRQVEDVVQQAHQGLGAVEHHACLGPLLLAEAALEQQAGHADDTVHGRADLVAHRGQEVRLRVAGSVGGVLGDRQLLREGDHLLALGLDRRFGVEHVLDLALQCLLAFVDPLLGDLAVGDVAQDADVESVAVMLGLADRELQGKGRAVLVPTGDLAPDADDLALPGLGIVAQIGVVAVVVRRRHQGLDVLADDLLGLEAEHPRTSRVVHADRAQAVDDDDAVHGGVEDRAMLVLAAAQGLLDALAVGDVPDDADEGRPAVLPVLADGKLHWKSRAVLALALDLAALADDLRRAALDIVANEGVVPGLIGFRHQHLDVSAHDLVGAVAEQRFAGAIEQADRAVGFDQNDAVDNGIENRVENVAAADRGTARRVQR